MMRKVCMLLLTQLLLFGTASYGAISEDMSAYVRKDVFEVYMQNINANMERIFQKLDNMESKINNLSDRVSVLSSRIDGLDARMGDIRNDIYLGLVILGIIIALPMVQKMLQAQSDRREARKPYVTLEEVIRLIEENNAKLGRPQ